jgi:hypothetical protein
MRTDLSLGLRGAGVTWASVPQWPLTGRQQSRPMLK